MKDSLWQKLALLGLLAFLPITCNAQWYQGPSGGRGGEPFDYWKRTGGNKQVRSVIVYYTNVIRCISVVYEHVGDSIESEFVERNNSHGCHLSPNEYREGRFNLDPDEFIIGVAGRYGDAVDSIRFYSSKKNSPVYGGSGGNVDFGYTATPGQKIVAFFGRASDNLDAIGVLYVRQ